MMFGSVASLPAIGALSLGANSATLDLDPAQIRSLHHQVQAFILKATYQGALNPGDRLNESTLSAQLGISRTPVREALTYLEGSGLVVRRPRHGFFLARLSAEDAAHCYAVRELLEGFAARQVTGRMTVSQVEILERIIDAMGRAVQDGDWPQAAVHNISFHETVVDLAGNPVLRRMWTSVGPVLWYFDSLTRRTVDPAAKENFVRRHRLLLAALRRNDAEAATAAFVSHIAGVKQDVIARLKMNQSVVERTHGKQNDTRQHPIRRGSEHEK
ncbi:MAG: GntR family transcriptional regulator [bacterium]